MNAETDSYHGVGGTYTVLADGRRVPSNPETGEPIMPAEAGESTEAAPAPRSSRSKS